MISAKLLNRDIWGKLSIFLIWITLSYGTIIWFIYLSVVGFINSTQSYGMIIAVMMSILAASESQYMLLTIIPWDMVMITN